MPYARAWSDNGKIRSHPLASQERRMANRREIAATLCGAFSPAFRCGRPTIAISPAINVCELRQVTVFCRLLMGIQMVVAPEMQ
jgi:hypothetical protein